MDEYNRFVSYLYAYENNRKTVNNGFVRVETRDQESSVYVNMKELYGSGAKYSVYMFQRAEGGLKGICLGCVEERQAGGEFFCKITKDNINDSGISLHEIAGIIILGENGRKYGTCWDDEPLDTEMFANEVKEERQSPPLKFIPEDEMTEEMMAESIALSMENTAEAAEFFHEPLLCGRPDDDGSAETKIKTVKKRLDRILDGGIKMYPFEDREMEQCIRMEIQDIGMLPMKYWFYAGNSFLIQSYYAYRHLILARRIDGSYILGVPGMGEAKDSFMARRFGFQCFKNIREKSDEIPASNFGYWYVKLI